MSNQKASYWDEVSNAEWLLLFVSVAIISVLSEIPIFSCTMFILMSLAFKILGSFFYSIGQRRNYILIVIQEIATLGLTIVITIVIKEFAMSLDLIFRYLSDSNIKRFKEGVDAGALTNSEKAIENATGNANLISDFLSEAFITAPFLTGGSAIMFVLLSYLITRLIPLNCVK
jgi:hypothetical protein